MSERRFLALAVVGILALLFVIVGGALLIDRQTCMAKADGMGRDWRYGGWSGCMVTADDGRWVPLENLREVDG